MLWDQYYRTGTQCKETEAKYTMNNAKIEIAKGEDSVVKKLIPAVITERVNNPSPLYWLLPKVPFYYSSNLRLLVSSLVCSRNCIIHSAAL